MKKFLLFILLFFISINVKALDNNKIKVKLDRCIDGDTAWFKYQDSVIKVRFLAIDTPEVEHENNKAEAYAYKAKNYTCNKLKKANNIYLEFDPNSDKQDKYERYLAWVFTNSELLQEKIVENGYAKVTYLYDNYKYTDILLQKEKEAKKNKLGIWSNKKDNNYYIIIPFIIFIILLFLSNLKKKKHL